MHRAYHAVQTPMTAKDGTPTNAVFGFLTMLCKFIEMASPDAVVCAFDAGKPVHRIEAMAQYKAQRPPMDEELHVQFPVIQELLESMAIPVVKVPGWEGDDILGTIAARDEALGYETLLVTGDKDAYQLASELTRIVTTKKGITDVTINGPAEVEERYGVTPAQFIDYLGLMGDSSDNIPGVPGIGPKTATKLLQTYGSMEGIYEHVGELKGKQKENIENNRETAFLSREIATIVTDLDFPLDLEAVSFPAFDAADVEEAFGKYQLASPLARVLAMIDAEPPSREAKLEVAPVLEGDAGAAEVARAVKAGETIGVAFVDPEQVSLFDEGATGAFATDEATVVAVGDDALALLAQVVREGSFVALDVKAELHRVYPADTAEPALVSDGEVLSADGFDLSVAGYVLNSSLSAYTYDSLMEALAASTLPEAETDAERAAIRATAARLLKGLLEEALKKDGSWDAYADIDLPLVGVLAVMERVGAAIDAAMPTVSGRAKVLLLAFAVIAAVFFLRLVFLQVIVSDQYSAMAEESRTVSFETTPRRGTIYDRNGIVLATSVEATTIYANPVEVTDAAAEAASLASVLGGDAADYRELLSTPSTTFVYIKRQADVEVADKVKELKLDGVYFIADTRREYPNGSIGGQVIGYCNVDGEGITGLELQYNDILSGTPGTYTAERGEQGFPIPGGVKEETPAVNGQDIMVSLDIKLQDTVEQALAEGVKDLETEEGSSIVMDGATGEIYAACSLPYMNPADMSSSQVGSESVKAITQAYEPGSTFKSVSALTILEQGTMGPEDTMFCPSSISADDYDVSDSHERDGETYSLREILNHSSNVGISLATEQAGFRALYDNIKRFHFTEPTGVDYPGEAGGNVLDFDNWAKITGYNVSFGQGIAVTPLQMVRFYSAIANDGTLVTPHFLISKPQSGEVAEWESEETGVDEAVLADMRSMLRSVVTDGTGAAADIEGYEVCGKTSTAEIASEEGGYKKEVYNIGFCGFIDNSSSNLVCFVGANEVYAMRQTTQIFNDIMENAVKQYNITSMPSN